MSLNSCIGRGEFPWLSIQGCINIDKSSVTRLVDNNEIELDSEALQFLRGRNGFKGILDYGTRDIDFFPNDLYIVKE